SFYTGVFFVASSIREYHTVLFFGWACALAILFTIDILVITSYLCSISRQIKCRRFFYNTFIAAVCRKAGETLGGKSLTGWVVLLFSCYTLVCIILTLLLDNNNYFGVDNDIIFVTALFAFIVVSIGLLIKNLEALTDIMKSSKSASQGEYTSINIKRITPTFSTFATDINNIQDGLKASIEEAVKGERMKADLITNVSHDLKTPLTSIISYVDLLDREVLNNKVAEGYVDVLVDKSQRLKQLIEDLIEASKASSGNLAVDAVKINLKELLLQACGEFEEKAQDVNLEFKINTNGEVLVNADGKHMWRIYENLLSNTIKYAMPNSRVYIDIYKTDKYGIMVMKNVSRDEINVNSENLAERFTRGDSSRTTEGSGLGLSIAKSLVVLQKGRFDIDIDGDVFKVTVEMPLWEEKNIDTPLSV
ncbi:MAG: sensor histidine kinase, partial [Anaerotignaceae bacterium]